MRELKFRAWDEKKKKMVYNVSPFSLFISDESKSIWEKEKSKNDDCIFEQYTGLKDKNGKEIYEGDIVKEAQGGRNVVTFDTEDIGSCGCCVPEFWGSGFRVSISSSPDRCEVIGNIHENPELLRRKKMDD